MFNHLKGCIFDLDGVLVDTARYHYLAWKRLSQELGIEFTEKDNERLKGVSRMTSLEILLATGNKGLDRVEKEKLASKKNMWYLEYIMELTPSDILPGSVELLESLRENGVKTAVGSASMNADLILERLQLSSLFDSVVDGRKVSRTKPDPEVFVVAALELGLHHNEVIVFEDAVAGIIAAKTAGMTVVGIGDPDTLYRADMVIPGLYYTSYNELIKLLL